MLQSPVFLRKLPTRIRTAGDGPAVTWVAGRVRARADCLDAWIERCTEKHL